MVTRPSESMFEAYVQASEKFDYLMAGVCTAVTTYVAKDLQPFGLLGISVLAEYLALAFLLGSCLCSFKRIEQTTTAIRLNYYKVRAEETRDAETYDRAGGLFGKTAEKAKTYYDWRNALLLLGILLVAISRVFQVPTV